MFAKTAKFQVASARQAASGSVRLAYSNDNTLIPRSAGGSRPARRPKLVCRWTPMIAGGLACYWDIEAADEAATAGPHQRWISVHGHPLPEVSPGSAGVSPALAGRKVGRRRAPGQLAVLVAG
jgi:hypothetical protein